MVTVGMYYEVRPGKEQVFEDTVDDVIRLLSQNSGHAKSFLYRDGLWCMNRLFAGADPISAEFLTLCGAKGSYSR